MNYLKKFSLGKIFCFSIAIFLLLNFSSLIPAKALEPPAEEVTETLPSLTDKFQQNLESCVAGDMNLDCWIGGANLVDPDAPSGVMPATINSLNLTLFGPNTAAGTTYRPNQPSGAIGGVGSLIANLYTNPPASSVEYFADLGRNLGILATPAYAQGQGFQGLRSILPIWKGFRNIAYMFFVIVFVLMGFAIMFRVKLDPQTVISIQTAIPRVVVALLLVTFSYAIAGLLIDLMYLTLFMLISFLHFAQIISVDVNRVAEIFLKGSVFSVVPSFSGMRGGSAALNMLLEDFLRSTGGPIIGTITSFFFGTLIGGTVGRALIMLILGIVILFKVLKLFFALLMSYIGIILGIIFAPLQLMLGVLPGSNAYKSWFRNLLANIMVFPAVSVFFILAGILVGSTRLTPGLPPLIQPGQTWMPPLLYVSRMQAITALIGLGMLLICDKIPEMVKKAFQVEPLPFGTAFGEALGPVTGPIKYGWGVAKDLGTTYITRRVFPPIVGGGPTTAPPTVPPGIPPAPGP